MHNNHLNCNKLSKHLLTSVLPIFPSKQANSELTEYYSTVMACLTVKAELNVCIWQLEKQLLTFTIFLISDDFDKINEKLKEAQDTSDVQSEFENYTVKKRKIKPRKIYDTSDEEQDNETLIRPPKI